MGSAGDTRLVLDMSSSMTGQWSSFGWPGSPARPLNFIKACSDLKALFKQCFSGVLSRASTSGTPGGGAEDQVSPRAWEIGEVTQAQKSEDRRPHSGVGLGFSGLCGSEWADASTLERGETARVGGD